MKKSAKANERQTGGTLEPLTDERSHTECFAQAARLFSQGDFATAREIFQRAAHGPVLSVNESASMYVRMCEQRLDRQRQAIATPEELYSRGLALLKQRRYTEAVASLEAAQRAEETARVRYALTLATGHIGDASAAARHFRRACELDPAIRETARHDADFKPLIQFPELRDAIADKA
jgi:tetratricopeptide (TPR) repeat protein